MAQNLLFRTLAIGVVVVGAAGCSDLFTPQNNGSLESAFTSVPLGYESAVTSFGDGAVAGEEGWGRRGGPGGGPGHGGPQGKMMGGGLGGPFLGIGFGPGFGRRPFGSAVNSDCAFDSASGRLVCTTSSDRGLTFERSIQYKDASGKVQSAFDTLTTNSVNVRASVKGTRTGRENFSTTVDHSSDQTVVGLAPGSTQRTVNGASSGKETTTGTNDTGQFTAVRNVSDKVEGVVIPVSTTAGRPPYPTAGTITRSMEVTLTYAGQTPRTSSRKEVITYDGSATAKLVITKDGVTQNCTVELPRGRPSCS